ncbi:MAG: ABC transporter permease subunit [Halobacteria archaeon]|nr:ABC transporter permease subunit [Halobacteria archaeon]
MLEIALFESRRKTRSILSITGFMTVLSSLSIALFPSLKESSVDLANYLEGMSPEVRRAFAGSVTDISTIEGFLVVEVYQSMWLLLLGVYFAYAAASLISSEVQDESLDLVLITPISRAEYVVGKFFSLVTTVVAVDLLMYLVVYFGVTFVDESVDPELLLVLHTAFVAYFLACSGLGLLSSVIFNRERKAQVVAIASIFGMFLVDTLTIDTDYEWVGDFAFSRYLDPGKILVSGDVDLERF